MAKPIDPVIVSGVSALAGVFISQTFSLLLSIFDKRHQKKVLLRQKYEEMMFYFSDSLRWIKMLHSASGTRQHILEQAPPPESRKVLSLCLLYFPDLVAGANNYIFAQLEYFEFVAGSFDESLPVTAGGQALAHPEGAEQVTKYMNEKNRFETLIKDKVNQYIKA